MHTYYNNKEPGLQAMFLRMSIAAEHLCEERVGCREIMAERE